MSQRIYGQDVIEAFWARACDLVDDKDRVPVRRILGELARDEVGLERKVEVPYRTAFDWLKKLKRERGSPRAHVRPGTEVDALQSIRRQAIEMLQRQLIAHQEREREANGDVLPERDVKTIAQILRTADEIEKREQRARIAYDPSSQRQRASAAAQQSSRRSLMDELVADGMQGGDGPVRRAERMRGVNGAKRGVASMDAQATGQRSSTPPRTEH